MYDQFKSVKALATQGKSKSSSVGEYTIIFAQFFFVFCFFTLHNDQFDPRKKQLNLCGMEPICAIFLFLCLLLLHFRIAGSTSHFQELQRKFSESLFFPTYGTPLNLSYCVSDFNVDDGPDRHPNPSMNNSEGTNASAMSASSPRALSSQLGVNFQPSDSSVICGRGKASYGHPGNYRLRMLASAFASDYSHASRKTAKSAIVAKIVADIRQEGGVFCKYEQGAWFEIAAYNAREKVSALLRDLLPSDYRSSAKAKTNLRRALKKQTQNTQTGRSPGHNLMACKGEPHKF